MFNQLSANLISFIRPPQIAPLSPVSAAGKKYGRVHGHTEALRAKMLRETEQFLETRLAIAAIEMSDKCNDCLTVGV